MATLGLLAILWITSSIFCFPQPEGSVYNNFQFVTRRQWRARSPVEIIKLNLPVPFVIIHHTYIPDACFTIGKCSASMRSMQNFHQLEMEWPDIGYNFAVGSDGVVYEGCGWETVGSHAYGFNSKSIGIVLIGDWVSQRPPEIQMNTTKSLIQEGVSRGYINESYDLIGHRQVKTTECPGQALFEEIRTWDRFQPNVKT